MKIQNLKGLVENELHIVLVNCVVHDLDLFINKSVYADSLFFQI